MFTFKSTLDLEKLDELKPLMVPRKNKVLSILYGLVFLLLAAAFFLQGSFIYGLVMLALLVLVVLSPKLKVKLSISKQKDRYREVYGKSKIEVEIQFTEDEIKINNLTSGGKGNIQYADLYKYTVSEKYLYLSTRADQFIVIDKKRMAKGEKEKLEAFLKTKNPRLF